MIPSELALTRDETVESVTSAVARMRGKPITVLSAEWLRGTGATGLWIPFVEVDEVLHLPTDSDLYRDQIILHELAHMILRHDELFMMHGFISDYPPARQYPRKAERHAFARSVERNAYEVAAEQLADELASVIRARPREPHWFEGVFG